jgi:hypothetical protein
LIEVITEIENLTSKTHAFKLIIRHESGERVMLNSGGKRIYMEMRDPDNIRAGDIPLRSLCRLRIALPL